MERMPSQALDREAAALVVAENRADLVSGLKVSPQSRQGEYRQPRISVSGSALASRDKNRSECERELLASGARLSANAKSVAIAPHDVDLADEVPI